MAVLVLEATRMRMEDLKDKLRRLTLINAASTQSFNVDLMLGVVLRHLVESLNIDHGVVRLISGSGGSAELIIRAAIGYDDAYLTENEKISTSETSAEEEDFQKDQRNCPFLQKPFGVDEFLALVQKRLGWNDTTIIRR